MKEKPIVATTDRLELRRFSLDDVEHFFRLNQDLELLRYTGDQPFRDLQQVEQFINAYDQYDKYGIGRWSVYFKNTEQYLGFCGLRFSEEHQEIDIGFRIARRYWNKGYATEAALASMKIGFNHRHPQVINDKIIGRAMMDNAASHAVLKKLGMQATEQTEELGQIWQKYQLSKQQFFNTHQVTD